MRLRNAVIAVAGSAVVAGAAWAQDATAIANRINVMKEIVGPNIRTSAMMVQGKQPFDAAAAKASMQAISAALATFPALFPPGSENVQDRAAPTIWSDAAGFKATAEKASADAAAAAAAADQGAEAFAAAFGAVGGSCQSCHEKYRAEE